MIAAKDTNKDTEEARRQKVLALRQTLSKRCGQEAFLDIEPQDYQIQRLPLGCAALDKAIGGGLPKGKIIEAYGPESCGKTTLALHAIAQVQAEGGIAVFINAENAYDPEYAAALGVDVEELIVVQPESGEAGLLLVQSLVIDQVDFVVVDSIAAFDPAKSGRGEHALMVSNGIRTINKLMGQSKTTLFITNQLRRTGNGGAGPEAATGGAALKFFASLRMELTPLRDLKQKDGGDPYGVKVRVFTKKNRTAPQHRTVEIDIIYGQGIQPVSV